MSLFGKNEPRLAWLLVIGWTLAGCGGEGGGDGETGGNASTSNAVSTTKRRTVAELPAVGEYLPPLDQGRVQIAPPTGWKELPPVTLDLAGFALEEGRQLPRITLAAWDTPLDEIKDLTEANSEQLAAELLKELEHDKKTVEEPPKPIFLGPTLYLRHVRRARAPSGNDVVVQALETVHGGRLYVIELVARIEGPRPEDYGPSLMKWRNESYAVAANLKFLGGEQSPSPPVEAPPPATKPEGNKPAEENPKP